VQRVFCWTIHASLAGTRCLGQYILIVEAHYAMAGLKRKDVVNEVLTVDEAINPGMK